ERVPPPRTGQPPRGRRTDRNRRVPRRRRARDRAPLRRAQTAPPHRRRLAPRSRAAELPPDRRREHLDRDHCPLCLRRRHRLRGRVQRRTYSTLRTGPRARDASRPRLLPPRGRRRPPLRACSPDRPRLPGRVRPRLRGDRAHHPGLRLRALPDAEGPHRRVARLRHGDRHSGRRCLRLRRPPTSRPPRHRRGAEGQGMRRARRLLPDHRRRRRWTLPRRGLGLGRRARALLRAGWIRRRPDPGRPPAARDGAKRRDARRRRKRLLLALAAAGVGALIVLALLPEPVPVDAARVVRGPLAVTVDEDGMTRVRDRYTISSPITGEVARIRLQPGDRVRPGELLTTISPTPLSPREREEAVARLRAAEASAEEALAAVAQAEAALEQAIRDRDR